MNCRHSILNLILVLLAGASLASLGARPAAAQDTQDSQADQEDYSQARIVRLSFVTGNAQYVAPGEDWQTATDNLPIQEGFHLSTSDGRAEVEFESGAIVRLAENSELEFSKLALANGGRITELNLVRGSVIVTVNPERNDSFVVDAPNMRVTVSHNSRFRLDTTQGDSWASVLKGDVQVATNSGDTNLSPGHTLHVSGANADQVSMEENAAPDDFDQWAADRDRVIAQGYSQATQYVAPNDADYVDFSYGMSDLSDYGYWTNLPGYGYCWQPYDVPIGWMPFYYGSWVDFGRQHHHWTWVSAEPWGWLPYHTGHWVNAGGRWAWLPGSTRTWNPAPVNWVRVGNQIGWTPAGTFDGEGQSPATRFASEEIVTGAMDSRGVIRPGARVPLTTETIAKTVPSPAPTPLNRPVQSFADSSNGVIQYDSATRTYVNSNGQNESAQARGAAGVHNDLRFARQDAAPRTPQAAPNSPTRPNESTSVPRYVAPAQPAPPRYVAPQPAPAPRYVPPPPPQQHYSPPPQPAAPHYSPPPAPPASHGGGGGSSGGRH